MEGEILMVESKELEVFEEENEESLDTADVAKFEEAVIWNTDWTVETIVSQSRKGNIDLNPKFQRRDAWNSQEKSKLIESLMLGIPVPPIILAEKKENRGKYIVIDGKQRLLAINQFFAEEGDEFKVLTLKSLQFLNELNNETYETIKSDYDRSRYLSQIENQVIRTVVIRNWPNEDFLYTVFLRLNTGSKKLSPQELRQALNPGEFLDYLDDATAESEIFRKLLNNTEADSRMRDVELALRYFAFKYNFKNYKGNLKTFLDSTCKLLNQNWENKTKEFEKEFLNLEKSITICFDIFGEKEAFSRFSNGKYNNYFNRPLFEILTYFLTEKRIADEIIGKQDIFKIKFEELSEQDVEFNQAITSTTNNVGKVVYRFNKLIELIDSIISKPTNKRLTMLDGTIQWVEKDNEPI